MKSRLIRRRTRSDPFPKMTHRVTALYAAHCMVLACGRFPMRAISQKIRFWQLFSKSAEKPKWSMSSKTGHVDTDPSSYGMAKLGKGASPPSSTSTISSFSSESVLLLRRPLREIVRNRHRRHRAVAVTQRDREIPRNSRGRDVDGESIRRDCSQQKSERDEVCQGLYEIVTRVPRWSGDNGPK